MGRDSGHIRPPLLSEGEPDSQLGFFFFFFFFFSTLSGSPAQPTLFFFFFSLSSSIPSFQLFLIGGVVAVQKSLIRQNSS